MIVESPVHGIQEEKFANTVDRFAVIDSFLVISANSNVQPVLVLFLVLPSCEGVLEITLIILSLIEQKTNPADFEEEGHDVSRRDDFLVRSAANKE